jgi:hypothetical protein
MIYVVARIIGPAVVSYPFVSGSVNVRRFWMARLIDERLMLGRCWGVGLGSAGRCGTMRGDVSTADAANCAGMCPALLLRYRRNKAEKQNCH